MNAGASPDLSHDRRAANPGSNRPLWQSKLILCAFLLLLAVLPYSNSLRNGFVYDDTTQVLDNPYILSFRHLGRIFSTPAWSYVRKSELTNYYRPMMTFGYLLCYQFFGAEPYGFHLANIFLHALVVLMLFFLTRRLFSSDGVAFLAAALFALHPIHSESVDWVAAVTDLEVTLFLLAAFWFYLRAATAEGRTSHRAFVGMSFFFILALVSKEQALMFPPLATVFEHFYRDDRRLTRFTQKILRYLILWVLALGYIVFRIQMFGAFAPVTGNPRLSRFEAAISAIALVAEYTWKLIWPANLSAYYVFTPSTGFQDPRVIAGLAALATCAVLFVILWKRARIASFGLIWFFATLAPVLNARVLASDNVFAERYLYLPSVGFCWLAAFGLVRLWQAFDQSGSRAKILKPLFATFMGIIAVICAGRIVTRNRVWRDEFTLDTVTLKSAPTAVVLYNNLGSVYWNRGDVDSAARTWETALEMAPRSATILNNLGLVALKRNNPHAAIEILEKAIAVEPGFPDAHLNLGVAYEAMGMKNQAESQYEATISLAPLNLHAHNRLGSLYLEEKRDADAETQFKGSVSIAPNVVAFDGLGRIQMGRKDFPAAEDLFWRSLALNPDDTNARMELAEMFSANGRAPEAFEQYKAILNYDPQNAAAREALDKLSKNHEPPH